MMRSASIHGRGQAGLSAVAVIVLGVLRSSVVRAEPPLPPHRIQVCSPSGAYCVTSDPDGERTTLLQRQPRDGAFTPVWSVGGWYPHVAVSDDGVLVTGESNLLRAVDCDETTTIVTFHHSATSAVRIPLSRVLMWADLLPRKARNLEWGHHVGWDQRGNYGVSTADFRTLYFDPATGALADSTRPPWHAVAVGIIVLGLIGLTRSVRVAGNGESGARRRNRRPPSPR